MIYDEPTIQSLLRDIQNIPPGELQPLLLKLMAQPLAFEFAIAASPVAAECLRQAFYLEPNAIPTNSSGFYSKTFTRAATAPLLPQVTALLSRDDAFNLAQRHRQISACFDALSELRDASFVAGVGSQQNRARSGSTAPPPPDPTRGANTARRRMTFTTEESSPLTESSPEGFEQDEEDNFFQTRQKQGNKKRAQKAAVVTARLALDARPFNVLGIQVPLDAADAQAAAWQVRDFLENNIEVVFNMLQRSTCVESLKAALLATSSASSVPAQTAAVAKPTAHSEPKPKLPKIATQPSEAPAQSVKGALSLEHIKEFGPWGIHLSSRAERDLRQARNGDQHTFKIILKKIKQLSDGHFSDDNQKKLTGREVPIPIYEAKMSRDSRLVYRVDCVADYGSEVERQILVVYGVYTHNQLERGQFWTSVGLQISRRGREYRKRCSTRGDPVDYKGDKVFHPQSFPAMIDVGQEDASDLSGLSIPQHDLGELHELLVLEKFTPLSRALLNSMFVNIDVTHPFNPSPFEKKIIEHPASCYVIGRSGTGKTTTLLFRLLAREHVYRALNDREPGSIRRPRQLFVTQSRVLAGKVEEYYRKLHESMDISDWTLEMLKTPSSAVDAQGIHARHAKRVEDLLHDDDERNYRADLPKKFSELKDEHFPLFLTMEKLCEMIEADVELAAPMAVEEPPASPVARKGTKQAIGKTSWVAGRKLMTYKTWLTEYWPHFAEYLTKGLDAALVYSEIMGVIKGSEESLQHAERHLSLATYENFSVRRQSTFAHQRKRIYDIFTAFQREKVANGHVDAADRTHAILTRLQANIRVIGQPIDFLYVDEAQDNLLIDALMLRFICCNPDGLFWAGDTAQTISVGSSFRFNDLRAFIHRVDKKRVAEDASAIIAHEPPELFELVVNYRSHGGIVSCAHSIIGLITNFWPDSIDNLAEERGVVDGGKPVFFTGWEEGNARYDQFLFGSNDNQIEFGARQCIIVRDEESKQRLREELGREIGVIFTVLEAKGLEFDDVLVFNFFNDSTVSEQQWRVVLNAIPEETNGRGSIHAPTFDSIRHAGVCADLKSLYVAITRARKNMWIVDRSDKGEPMRMVWSANNQIQNCTPDTEVPHIAVGSSQGEWASQARMLFRHGRFSQAAHCFERGEQPHHAAVATAYHLRKIADEKPLSQTKKLQEGRAIAYLAAGDAFEAAALPEDWGFNARERQGYFRIAGDCLQQVGKEQYRRAALCFERGHEFMTAAKLYREIIDFREAVRIIRGHNLEEEYEDARAIIRAAKLYYFKNAKIEEGCQLFDDPEEALEYLDDRGLDVAQTEVLGHMQRWEEAGELHLQEGRTLMAADAFLEAKTPGANLRARDVVVNALSEQITFGRIPTLVDPGIQHIRRLLDQLKVLGLADDIADEVNFFDIIVRRDVQRLEELIAAKTTADEMQRDFAGDNEDGKRLLALFLFFNVFSWKKPPPTPLSTQQIFVRLQLTLSLIRLLRAHLGDRGSVTNPVIQKLFGFREYAERQYLVLTGTYLYRAICNQPKTPQTRLEEGILIQADILQDLYRRQLRAEIKMQVTDMATVWSDRGQVDVPCLQYLFFGCNNDRCPRSHISETDCTADAYINRVKAHLLPLAILSTVDGLLERSDVVKRERTWSARLYETLRPVTSKLGTPSMLDVHELAHSSAQSWIRPQLYSLKPDHGWCLTTAARCAYLSCNYNPDAREVGGILANAPLLKPGQAIRMGEDTASSPALTYLFNTIQASTRERRCFLQGAEFLNWILERGELFEVVLFADLFEELVTNIFMARSKDGGSVFIPKSWCLAALRKKPSTRVYSLDHVRILINVGKEYLLQLLDSWRGGLYFQDHKRLVRDDALPPLVRAVLINRMCNALCIIGCNISLPVIQTQVYTAIKVIQRQHFGAGAGRVLYERYQQAKEWSDLRAVTQSALSDSKTDCMIQCARHRFGVVPPTRRQKSVFFVYFKTYDELIDKLNGLYNDQDVPVTARKSAAAFEAVPVGLEENIIEPALTAAVGLTSARTSAATESVPEAQPRGPTEHRADTEDASTKVDKPDVEEDPVDEPPDAARDGPEHQAKAQVIQRWFRRQRKSRRTQDMSSGVRSYHIAFREASAAHAVGTGFYRKLMFGPLPHLMLALQRAETKITTVRRELNKQLLSGDQELETLDIQLTSTSKAVKALKSLRDKLKPGATVHIARDVHQLQMLVLECEAQLHGLPGSIPRFDLRDIADEVYMARRGIVDRPQPPRQRAIEPSTLSAANDDDGYLDDADRYEDDYQYEDS